MCPLVVKDSDEINFEPAHSHTVCCRLKPDQVDQIQPLPVYHVYLAADKEANQGKAQVKQVRDLLPLGVAEWIDEKLSAVDSIR